MLTDAKMSRLKTLLKEKEIDISRKKLNELDDDTNPNYALLHNSIKEQKYDKDKDGNDVLVSGYRGAALEGSSRSGKTWTDIVIHIDGHFWIFKTFFRETERRLFCYRASVFFCCDL